MHAESPPPVALNRHPLDRKKCAESPPPKTYSSNTYSFLPVVDRPESVDKSLIGDGNRVHSTDRPWRKQGSGIQETVRTPRPNMPRIRMQKGNGEGNRAG